MTTSYNLSSRNFQKDFNIKDWPKPTINFEFNWPYSVLDNSTGWNHHICVRSRFNLWLNIQLPHGCLFEPIHIVHFVPSWCMKLEEAWLYSLEYPHLNPACLEVACYIFYFHIVVSIEFFSTYKYCVFFPLSWVWHFRKADCFSLENPHINPAHLEAACNNIAILQIFRATQGKKRKLPLHIWGNTY